MGRMAEWLDSEMLRGFCDRRADRQKDEQTFAIVESLSRLKKMLQTLCCLSTFQHLEKYYHIALRITMYNKQLTGQQH